MNPAEWLDRSAARHPDRPALLAGAETVDDYRGFARSAAAVAGGLSALHGVSAGDRVALFAKNSTGYLVALYAIWRIGAVAVPINAKLHPLEAAYIIEDAGAALVIADPGMAVELGNLVPDAAIIALPGAAWESLLKAAPLPSFYPTRGSDLVWLFYTSGTTGKPKGVMLEARNVEAMTLSYLADVDQVLASDAVLYAAPMSHGAGLYNFVHVIVGARHVVPVSGGFDAEEVLDMSERLGGVSMFAAPTMVRRLVDAARMRKEPGAGIRTVVYGGGPMYLADIVEAVEVMGPRFVQIYGQGECPMTITALGREEVADRTHPRWRERLGSVGQAQSVVRLKIADPDGAEIARGEVGEILVQGQAVMRGYWRNDEASAKTLRDGWLWTGDMGAMDGDGYLTLHDRSRDVIISGGSNIYPREIEEILLEHPELREVSVIGRTDPDWGEVVVAYVVGDAPVEALDALCLGRIARFKRPKDYVFVAALPKNNYGKVLKTELREMDSARVQ